MAPEIYIRLVQRVFSDDTPDLKRSRDRLTRWLADRLPEIRRSEAGWEMLLADRALLEVVVDATCTVDHHRRNSRVLGSNSPEVGYVDILDMPGPWSMSSNGPSV